MTRMATTHITIDLNERDVFALELLAARDGMSPNVEQYVRQIVRGLIDCDELPEFPVTGGSIEMLGGFFSFEQFPYKGPTFPTQYLPGQIAAIEKLKSKYPHLAQSFNRLLLVLVRAQA